jgi:hypothetical protein
MNSGRHRQVIFWLPPNAFPSAGYGVVTLENKRFFLEIIEIGIQLKVIRGRPCRSSVMLKKAFIPNPNIFFLIYHR